MPAPSVLIRGVRIELGEIEHVVEEHPDVVRAIAVAPGRHAAMPERDTVDTSELVLFVVRQRDALRAGRTEPRPGSSAADAPASEPGVIADRVARIEFRLSKPGMRRDLRGERFELNRPALDDSLRALFFRRRTERAFTSAPMTHTQLSALLLCLMEFASDDLPFPKLRYASAGNLYPVQVYLYVKSDRVDGLAGGAYYYDREHHELVMVARGVQIERSAHTEVNRPIFDQSALSLYLIADDSAIRPIYGERAREFCLLEAGYMGQLIQETAGEQALGAAPAGYQDFAAIRDLFRLTEHHWLSHCLFVGPLPERDEVRIAREVRELAPYVEPADIRFVEELPISADGRLDRQALTRMAARREESSPSLTGERTARTRVRPTDAATGAATGAAVDGAATDTCLAEVASIWQRVLRQDSVDSTDNFFELGGNSLIAAQLVATLRSRLGVEVPLRTIFDHPYLFDFAERVRARVGARSLSAARREPGRAQPPLIEARVRPPGEMFPVSAAERDVFFFMQVDDPERAFSTVPLLLELQGALDQNAMQSAIGALLERHEILRSIYCLVDGVVKKTIAPSRPFRWQHIPIAAESREVRRGAVFTEVAERVRRVLDIESDISFAGYLYQVQRDLHFLLLVMPHIMVDYESLAILKRDLCELYDAHTLGRRPGLPSIEFQYADYVDYTRREIFDSGAIRAQEAYWSEQLSGARPVDVPTDHPRARLSGFYEQTNRRISPGCDHHFSIPADQVSALQSVAESGQASLFMALLASFVGFLSRQTGQTDISIFSSYHHRQRPGTEVLVGPFTTPQILRFDVTGDPGFAALIARVRATLLDAYAHPDFRVSRSFGPELFRINFNYHVDRPRSRETESGLTITHHQARKHISTRMELMPTLRLRPSGVVAGTVLYSSLLYERESIARMLQRWTHILERGASQPQTALSAL